MENIIILLIILAIIGGASFYVYREKKKGNHCIGCPYAKNCKGKNCNMDK